MRHLAWLQAHNQHAIVGIQGMPGSGKSNLGVGLALAINPAFNREHIFYNRDKIGKMFTAPKGQVWLLDEGGNVALNRTWQDRSQVKLMQAFNTVRQRNHIFIWATPNLERLDVILRADLLTHRINLFPAPSFKGVVQVPAFDRSALPIGFRDWKGRITWPNLEQHPIYPDYIAGKEQAYMAGVKATGFATEKRGRTPEELAMIRPKRRGPNGAFLPNTVP